ncbi:MAG TPA: hypothetical protein VI140_02475 [Oxalicibacterium sp.]
MQDNTVSQARGNAPRNPCFTMGKFVNNAMQRSAALQGSTAMQARGNAASKPLLRHGEVRS